MAAGFTSTNSCTASIQLEPHGMQVKTSTLFLQKHFGHSIRPEEWDNSIKGFPEVLLLSSANS